MLTEERQEQAQAVTIERTVGTEPADVYRAFTASHALRDWLSNAAQAEPRVGGRFYLWWNSGYYAAGTFTELAKNERIALTWRGTHDKEASELQVEIRGNGDGTSTIALTHTAPHAGPEPAKEAWLDEARRDWESALENLQSCLETGVDLRFARRPMFGLSDADVLDAESAAKLGVPVSEGIKLNGLVDGMGAQAAGIQKDDVLVGLGGYPITEWTSLGHALQHYKAGDIIDAVLYRNGEKLTLPVTLSARPSSELPDSVQSLAEQLRATHATLDAELDALFEGVTEAQADWRPEPGAWNVKEILAHLLASERDTQVWIASLSEDADNENVFHSNDNVRVRAIVAMNPTARDMVQALKRAEAETLATVEALTPQATARKHSFRPIVTWLTTFDTHHREHFGLIKTMLESASK